MMDCDFLERERYVKEKKKDKVTRAVGFVGTKHVPGFCDVFWVLGSVSDSGKCFWILASVLSL